VRSPPLPRSSCTRVAVGKRSVSRVGVGMGHVFFCIAYLFIIFKLFYELLLYVP